MLVFEEEFPSNLKSVVSFLTVFKEKYLESLCESTALRDRIEYVVMEAVDNACDHGNQRDEKKVVIVRCWEEDDFLIFSVRDEGEGFNQRIPDTVPDLSDINGRGLYSIQQFAHSVSFNDRGNMITFTFRTR